MLPRRGAPQETLVVIGTTELPGDLRDRPVVVGVLERARHAFAFFARVDEAGALVGREARAVLFGAVHHRLVGQLHVEPVHPFRQGVGDHGDRVVADHRVGLVGGELPHRQAAAVFVLTQERLDEIAGAGPVDQREQRVQRAKGVPQREDRVVGEPVGPVDLEVTAAILAVDVHVDIRREHRVVERGVEDGATVGRAPVDADLGEFLLPRRVGGGPDGIEIPSRQLGVHVLACALNAHRGDRDLHLQRFATVPEIERRVAACR